MSDSRFTGERLHAEDGRFALDLARHAAAYEYAAARVADLRVLELGCGGGHGAARLARAGASVVAVDRVAPDAPSRVPAVAFCRGDVAAPPLRGSGFDAVVSFQVIEHLHDPAAHLRAIGSLLAPGGSVLLTTPNIARSDGVNPYHVHEYTSQELRELLSRHFAEVELLGVGTSEVVREHLEARSRRILRILRLDPLGLRERLPRAWIEPAFAWGARWVRWHARRAGERPEVSWRDFPIGPADDTASLDWLAVCRGARP